MPPIILWSFWNLALLLAGYLLGSLPMGYLLGRWLKGIDIRDYGSGSTGATNVLRTLGKGPGLTVLLVDIAKGALAIALVQWAYQADGWLLGQIPDRVDSTIWFPWMVVLAGLMAILGHSKSIWLKFTGGKSVATSLGILLAMNWVVGLATLGVFGVVVAISRIVSLSSISGAIALPLLMVVTGQPLPYLLFAIAGGLFVIVRHRSNVERLLAGTEPRLGQAAPLAEPLASNSEAS